MKIEIFEVIEEENRMECRIYEIENGCERILINKKQHNEVWGFSPTDKPYQPRQVGSQLIDIVHNVIILAI